MTGAFGMVSRFTSIHLNFIIQLLEKQLFSKYDGFSLPVSSMPKDDAIFPITMQDSKTYMKLGFYMMKS